MNGFKHPKGYYSLFSSFLLERAGYYGALSLLTLFMMKKLGLDYEQAGGIYGYFLIGTMLAPFLLGYFVDLLGIKRSAIISCGAMALGTILLSMSSVALNIVWLYFGLSLLVLGQGFFKPAIYTLLGGIYQDKSDPRRDSGFTLILLAVNFGALIAPIVCGFFGEKIDLGVGFLFAGLFCMSSMFLLKKVDNLKFTKHKGLTLEEKNGIYALIVFAVFVAVIWSMIDGYSDFISSVLSNSAGELTQKLGVWTSIISILTGIVFVPFFAWFWVHAHKKGILLSATSKFIVGFLFFSLSFILFYLVFNIYQRTAIINIPLLMLATIVSSVAELLIMPIALSYVTKLSPVKVSAFIVGLWLLLQRSGRFITNLIPEYGKMSDEWIFAMPFILCLISVFALKLFSKPLRRWMGNVQ